MTKRPGQAGYGYCRRNNRPPEDQAWLWITAEMMESEAWRALTGPAIRVVMRLMLEHMHHGGTENGNLACTYDDFQKAGIDRHSIRTAIAVAEALGFIDVVERGMKGHGSARRPSRYAITWLPRNDDITATNRWAKIDAERVQEAIAAALKPKKHPKQAGGRHGGPKGGASLPPSPSPSQILIVVGKSPLEKTQQIDDCQWGKPHWTSGVNNTHSSGENSTGEKSIETAEPTPSVNGTAHPIEPATAIPLPFRLQTNFLKRATGVA